jgi:hypothetical protein
VGNERRDYTTLVDAAKNLEPGVPIKIVGGSPWSTNGAAPTESNGVDMEVLSGLSYVDLRQYYHNARVVAVPLHPSNQAAGINSVNEASSTARPLVVTSTPGLEGYPTYDGASAHIPPYDSEVLADAIAGYWSNQCNETNDKGRILAEEHAQLDDYVQAVAHIISET